MKTKTLFLVLLCILCSSFTPMPYTSDNSTNIGTIVENNNHFAFELYRELSNEKGNLFFSPFSISSALAMAYAGAREETERQMSRVLHFSRQETLHHDFDKLMKQIKNTGESTELHIANALWGQKNYGFLDDFIQLTKTYYGAGLRQVDFAGNLEETRQIINHWVEEQTHDKIKELLKEDDVSMDTRLVLTNAIYFKGQWEHPFEEKWTQAGEFYTGESTQDALFMRQGGYFNYTADEQVQVLELPYRDSTISMLIFLPKRRNELPELEKNLTPDSYKRWLLDLKVQKINKVALPKFKYKSRYYLKKTLKQMGMPLAFNGADFSGMTGKKGLYISKVIHQGYVEINEIGTEAAAATAVTTGESMGIHFIANHPFLFIIKDNSTGSILFIGRMTEPAI